MDAELGEDVLYVVAHRCLGQEQPLSDPSPIETLGQELKHFALARREHIETIVRLL
jgi:hypothetical protein